MEHIYSYLETQPGRIWMELSTFKLHVNHDLNIGKILQPQYLNSSIVPEGYLVSWSQWLVFFLQLINYSYVSYLRLLPEKTTR
jgi:hypothetical protein